MKPGTGSFSDGTSPPQSSPPQLLQAPASDSTLEAGEEAPCVATLQSLNEALAAAPERVDLWMIRFETLAALRLKSEFTERLQEAWRRPALRRRLNAVALRRLWDALSAGEPLPDDVHLPALPRDWAESGMHRYAVPTTCRFAEVAMRLAGEELTALAMAYRAVRARPGFLRDFARSVGPLLGRPSPLHPAARLNRRLRGAGRIFLKREDQRRSSAERENAFAQAYLGSALGARVLVTAGDEPVHAVEVARAARHFHLSCLVVLHTEQLADAAYVSELRAGDARIITTAHLRLGTDNAREAALLVWKQAPDRRYLALSLRMGPPPYPAMVGDASAALGLETELQWRAQTEPDRARSFIAAVHSEADPIGFLLPHLGHDDEELVLAEPEGGEVDWRPSRRLSPYNGFQREHQALRSLGRVSYVAVSDGEAREAQNLARRWEDVSLSLEDARALAFALLRAEQGTRPRDIAVLCA